MLRQPLIFCIPLTFSSVFSASGDPEINFRSPSKEISEIIQQPWVPLYNPDPTRRWLMRLDMENQVSMKYLAREEIQLGGFNMYAETRARSRRLFAQSVSIVDIYTGVEIQPDGLPEAPIILQVQWSPNGNGLALLLEREARTELWYVKAETGNATNLSEVPVHAGMDHMIHWASDSQSVFVKTVPSDLGPRPLLPNIPKSALVRETADEALPAQTHQGVLRNRNDVELFEYFFKSQIVRIGLEGSEELIGEPGIYRYFRESPDGNYLMVERLVKPWSFLVNHEQFAYDIEIWDLRNGDIKVVASSPLAEYLPYGGGSVRRGAREFQWRSDKPATLVWVEAQDRGNPYQSAKIREHIYSHEAPFTGSPELIAAIGTRFGNILWDQEDRALVISWDWVDRRLSLIAFNPSDPTASHRRLLQYELGDRYRYPGLPLLSYNQFGFPVLTTDSSGEYAFLKGDGASLAGDRPFLDQINLNSKRKKRLFRSGDSFYENVISVLDADKGELLVTRESVHSPPNHFVWNPKDKFQVQATYEKNPFSKLESVVRKQLRYKRGDGVALTANLYLPLGYNMERDGPLPTLVWAYPRAYQSASNASQITKSPNQFVDGRWNRPVIWALKGYAVVDDPAMPIVRRKRGNPNDSFIDQLIDSAEALVDELIDEGISENGSIAIGGHSYGAFMTANLLAHTDLFCAGIARSGAFNRTLTPFGFQSEERNLWQAPRAYLSMSPFIAASGINEPLLLLHGEKDENPGTFTLQSERLFHALNGLGQSARLVLFANEGHTIRGDNSIEHMLWEMERWLELNVKGHNYPYVNPTVSDSGIMNISDGAAENSEEN